MTQQVPCVYCARRVPDALPICQTCTDDLATDLKKIPDLIDDLTITRARLDKTGDQRVGGRSADTPLPIRLTGKLVEDKDRNTYTDPYEHNTGDDNIRAEQALTRLIDTITTTGQAIAHNAGRRILHERLFHVLQTSHTDATALAITPSTHAHTTALWLAYNPNLIRIHPDAKHLYNRISNAIDAAYRTVDLPEKLIALGPCPAPAANPKPNEPNCGFPLRAEPKAEWVRCSRCRTQHKTQQIITTAEERVKNRYMPLTEIGKYCALLGIDVPKSTLYDIANKPSRRVQRTVPKRGWLHTNPRTGEATITQYWINRNDPPVYRLGDAITHFQRLNNQPKGNT